MDSNEQFLSDGISTEIQAYRQRQLTTFREALIVQALITWGVGQLGISQTTSFHILPIIRFIAGVACLVAGGVGIWVIFAYKVRIYLLRDRRNELASSLVPRATGKGDSVKSPGGCWYYPTDTQKTPTSYIYSITIIAFSLFTAAVNILMGLQSGAGQATGS